MVATSRVDLSGWRWGPRLIGAFAPRCPEVSSWGSDASIPGQVAAPPPRAGGRVSRGVGASMAHLRPCSRLGKWSS
jgi:hypothetical protein